MFVLSIKNTVTTGQLNNCSLSMEEIFLGKYSFPYQGLDSVGLGIYHKTTL